MGKKDVVEHAESAAREGFDLRERLLGVAPLTKEVTVYTDAVTGKELGGAEDVRGQGGIVLGRRRWGVLGELEEAQLSAKALLDSDDVSEEKVAALEAKAAELTKKSKTLLRKLEKTALHFTLQAVPDLVIRDTRRKAKQFLGIKGKGIDGREEEFALEYSALLLAASVKEWKDGSTGQTYTSLTDEQARDLRDFLPQGQFNRLDTAMLELSFETQIGNHATDSADFS
jgi:hypothetical protein